MLHNKSQYRSVLISFFLLGKKEGSAIQSSFLLAIKKVLHSKQKGFA
jgi:hypothetical protein